MKASLSYNFSRKYERFSSKLSALSSYLDGWARRPRPRHGTGTGYQRPPCNMWCNDNDNDDDDDDDVLPGHTLGPGQQEAAAVFAVHPFVELPAVRAVVSVLGHGGGQEEGQGEHGELHDEQR